MLLTLPTPSSATSLIRTVNASSGSATLLAGGVVLPLSADGTGSNVFFGNPLGVAVDSTASIAYVADSNTDSSSIRAITLSTGTVTTLAGGGTGLVVDSVGADARFAGPQYVALSSDDKTLYVSDLGNKLIRSVDISSRAVTTLAGGSLAGDGFGTNAGFSIFLQGLACNATTLFVSDNCAVRQIDLATAMTTTLAGDVSSSNCFITDGSGTNAAFALTAGLCMDPTSSFVYVVDSNAIRVITLATRNVATLTGSSTSGFADGVGSVARFNSPQGLTLGGMNLYVVDSRNGYIRSVSTETGLVSTLTGNSPSAACEGPTPVKALFNTPRGITAFNGALSCCSVECVICSVYPPTPPRSPGSRLIVTEGGNPSNGASSERVQLVTVGDGRVW